MSSRDPWMILLGASLALNVALLALLVAMRQRGEEASQPVEQVVQVTETQVAPTLAGSQPTQSPVEPTPTTIPPTPTATAVPVEPAAEATATEPPPPAPEPTATPTAAPEPTATPTPLPTVALNSGPDWLRYVNRFRSMANLPLLAENVIWSEGDRLHSIYMVNTGQIWHDEDPTSPFYTRAGKEAAENGNLAVGFIGPLPFAWAINYWVSAPFHAIPIFDPELQVVGFGAHQDENGVTQATATMDVKRGIGPLPPSLTFPILFPGDGAETWVLRYSLPEFPDAVSSCPGYARPTGPPIIVQIGSGDETPDVSNTSLTLDGASVDHCLFHEGNYVNADSGVQNTGRLILDQRDAIVILPRNPFAVGQTYTVNMEVNGLSLAWSFNTVAPPEQ